MLLWERILYRKQQACDIKDNLARLVNKAATSIFHAGRDHSEVFVIEFSIYSTTIFHYCLREIQDKTFTFWDKLGEMTRSQNKRNMEVISNCDEVDEWTKDPAILNYYVMYCEAMGRKYFGVPCSYYDTFFGDRRNANFFSNELENTWENHDNLSLLSD